MKKFKRKYLILASLLLVFFSCKKDEEKVIVYLVGDSTVSFSGAYPGTGWGEVFQSFFTNGVDIRNYANDGESSKSFFEDGYWSSMIDKAKSGNYIFIQFGHLDNHSWNPHVYTTPQGTYKTYLSQMITEAQEIGARPVLVSPPVTRAFNGTEFYDALEEYAMAMSQVADSLDVDFLDLHQKSKDLVVSLGPENSKYLYMWLEVGEYSGYPNGLQDDTHFTDMGAREMAGFVSDELSSTNLPVRDFLEK